MSNLVFPLALSGAIVDTGEATGDVVIDRAASGKSVTSSYQSTPRYRYKVTQAMLRSGVTPYEFQELQSFFARHRGQLDTFLVLDAEDNAVTDHGFGLGDNVTTAFQLQRSRLGLIRDTLGGPWLASSKPRTNLCLRSEQFDNAAWTAVGVTVAANSVLAPDGTLTADRLVEVSGATPSGSKVTQGVSFPSAPYAVLSAFGRAGERTELYLGMDLVYIGCDLSAGVVAHRNFGSGTDGGMAYCGNGWWRVWLVNDSGTTLGIGTSTLGGTGDNTKGIYVWGAQFEAGSTPTPYVKTLASAQVTNPAYWPLYTDGFEPITDLNRVGGPLIYVGGVLKTLGTDYTLSSRGVVTFASAPAVGAVLSWTGAFYRRCRFSNPNLSLSRIVNGVWRGSVEIESVI